MFKDYRPKVEVNNRTYFSDRFYINEPEDGIQDLPQAPPPQVGVPTCQCGVDRPPPTFSRRALIKSLTKHNKLQAAIFGTFSLDLNWVEQSFPELAGPNSTVPTLILHGKKGLQAQMKNRASLSSQHPSDLAILSAFLPDQLVNDAMSTHGLPDSQSTAHSTMTAPPPQPFTSQSAAVPPPTNNIPSFTAVPPSSTPLNEHNSQDETDLDSLQTQQENTPIQQRALAFGSPGADSTSKLLDPRPAKLPSESLQEQHLLNNSFPELMPPRSLAKQTSNSVDTKGSVEEALGLGSNLFLAEVKPACSKLDEDVKNGVSREPENERGPVNEYKRGVHHPKFALLLEKPDDPERRWGNLIVWVSTSNLTRIETTEGTWVQRFTRLGDPEAYKNPKTDFGIVLQDFLSKLSEQSDPLSTNPSRSKRDCLVNWFMDKYFGCPLSCFDRQFNWDKACVDLIPTIPGDYKCKPTGTQSFVYGRQRVSQVLARSMSRNSLVQSEKDRLIFQPTSIGANWDVASFADVVAGYRLDAKTSDMKELVSMADIVWPSHKKMARLKKNVRDLPSASILEKYNFPPLTERKDDVEEEFPSTRSSQPVLFMSSRIFNGLDDSCVSRMVQYETANEVSGRARPDNASRRIPHFKSLARVLDNQQVHTLKLKSDKSCLTAEKYFSWFMLTSACFSFGAQGYRNFLDTYQAKQGNNGSTTTPDVKYANFELGVLFRTCKKPAKRSSDKDNNDEPRTYCYRPSSCVCEVFGTKENLIHLPIPYSLERTSFFPSTCADNECEDMIETPYFHQLHRGDMVKNIARTPWGKKRIAAQEKKRNEQTKRQKTNRA